MIENDTTVPLNPRMLLIHISIPICCASGLNAIGQIFQFEWSRLGWLSALIVVCYILFQKRKIFFTPREEKVLNQNKKARLRTRTYIFAALFILFVGLDQIISFPQFLNFYEVIPGIFIVVLIVSASSYFLVLMVPMSKAQAITLNVFVPYFLSFIYFPAMSVYSSWSPSMESMNREYRILRVYSKSHLSRSVRSRQRNKRWCVELRINEAVKDDAPLRAFVCNLDKDTFEVGRKVTVKASKGSFGSYMMDEFKKE